MSAWDAVPAGDLMAGAAHRWGPHWLTKCSIRASMFDRQLELHDCAALFKACAAGRRGGKSDGIAKSSCMDVLDAGPNEVVLLGADTLKKARGLHWANVAACAMTHGVPLTPNQQGAYWETPWGARIQFWGINDAMSVELMRGFKLKSARFDECATYAPMLERMVRDVLEPALGDTGGSLTLYGTPSYTRAGGWYDICEGRDAPKWTLFRWDARDNPFFRADRGGAAAYFADVIRRNGWTWDTPAFRREYLGEFVDDSGMMVCEFVRERDCVDALPEGYSLDWPHVVGADYGYSDAFALAVTAMSPLAPTARYVVHAETLAGADYDQCAEALKRVAERWRPRSVVCDPAGGGKPFYETFNRKYGAGLGIAVRSAHKVAGSLAESIRFLNTELRAGRLKLLMPGARPLADEMQVLPWKDEWRDTPHDAYAQDAFDAVRYALMETIAWQPREAPTPETESAALEREIKARFESKARARQDTRRW